MNMEIRVAKTGESVAFDVEALPKASLEYVLRYGLTQAVNDAAASVARKNYEDGDAGFAKFVADATAKVMKRVEQINSGEVPGPRGPTDPKVAKIRALAKAVEAQGLDLDTIDPEKLVAWLKRQKDSGRTA